MFVELFDDADDDTTVAGSLEPSILTIVYSTSDHRNSFVIGGPSNDPVNRHRCT